MRTTEIPEGVLDAAVAELAGAGPVRMVNFLRYRTKASYAEPSELPECAGKEAYYMRYVPAFNAVPGAEQTKIVLLGNVQAVLVAPDGETWDDIAIVEYPSLDVLRDIVNHPKYKIDAALHRLAALEDWRFIVTTPAKLPT